MANCAMARYLDANDIYIPASGSLSGSGHFSDAIPAILAVAETAGSSGEEFVEAVIVAYEVQARLAESLDWLDHGFHSVSQVTCGYCPCRWPATRARSSSTRPCGEPCDDERTFPPELVATRRRGLGDQGRGPRLGGPSEASCAPS